MPGVTTLIVRFKAGSGSAYLNLFQTFFPGQVEAAGRRLGRGPVGPADAEDVALSVFHRLWREVANGNPLRDTLTDRDSLLRTLALLTGQKVRRLVRDARRQKRDARRTVREADLPQDAPAAWCERPDPAPGPGQQALFRATLADALSLLTPLQKEVVLLRLAGHTSPEIARRVRRTVRTVERQLSEVRSAWEESDVLTGPACRERRCRGEGCDG